MSSIQANATKSPLEAAQKIVVELTGMPSEHQKLALKFATETLGLQNAVAQPTFSSPTQLPHTTPAQVAGSTGHSTDIRSFKEAKAPKSDQQFVAVVAYFYQFEAKPENRKEVVDAETMKEAARLAGWAQVERWSDPLNNAKRAGYLDAAGTGKFKLSSVGENLVAITLPNNGGTSPTNKGAPKKLKKKPVNKIAKKKA